MRHSPFYQEIVTEGSRDAILDALTVRFGSDVATEFTEALNSIAERDRLRQLLRSAIKCRDIGGFRRALRRQQA